MRKATFNNKPIQIQGEELKVGDVAPDFEVINIDMAPIKLSDFKGKVVVINAIPSVDTPICNKQIIRFNQEATLLNDAIIIFVSVDLPFALERFCGTNGINNVKITSDYKNMDMGSKYGIIINDMKIYSRAVFVVDKEGIIRYSEYTPEVNSHPNYDKALEIVKKYSK